MEKHENLNEISELRKPVNLNAIAVEQYKQFFVIKPDPVITAIESNLLIELETGRIQEIRKDQKMPFLGEQPKERKGCAFLGLIHIKFQPFLVFAGEVKPICTIENSQIYEIHSIFFKAFNKVDYNESSAGRKLLSLQNHLKKLFSSGFYFSYQYDLTLSKQSKSKGHNKENQFAWNMHLMKDLIQQNISSSWHLPLIYGYVGYIYTVASNKKRLDYYLISRKSRYQAGTSFNVRGLDDEGNVANFVETEIIIYFNKYCCSSVFLRGTVPIFWSQDGQVKLSQSDEITHYSFLKHFDALQQTYGKILCLNLMSKSKQTESVLTEAYEQHFVKAGLNFAKYQFIDFNATQKKDRNEAFNDLLNKQLESIVNSFSFYADDMKNWSVLQEQIGVFRINCLDCLNRSNQAMQKISLKILQMMLKSLGVVIPQLNPTPNSDILSLFENQLSTLNSLKQKSVSFVSLFQDLWDQNANQLSRAYSGTDATPSSSKQGFFAFIDQGVKGINKLYQQNFEDQAKQGSIDLLLGQTIFQNLFTEKIKKVLKKRESDFTTLSHLNVFCVSWNMNGNLPDADMNFAQNILNFDGNPNPDIIIVGLQEMVKLNVQNVMMTNNEKAKQLWLDYLTKQLNLVDKYKLLKQRDLVGIFMIMFVKEPFVKRIKRLESEEVKTGLGGKLGNKGGVVIRFSVDDSNICLVNVHLESGQKNTLDRLKNVQEIHQRLLSNRKDSDYDYRVFMGDMNFRVSLSNSETRLLLDKYENSKKHSNQEAELVLRELLREDQLNQMKDKSEYLRDYYEHQITFPPTYKYDIGTQRYDTSKKQRTPSWCDRILLWHDENRLYKQHFYVRKEVLQSDHRPVVAYYDLEIKKIDSEKRAQIIKVVYNQSDDDIDELEKMMEFMNQKQSIDDPSLLLTLKKAPSDGSYPKVSVQNNSKILQDSQKNQNITNKVQDDYDNFFEFYAPQTTTKQTNNEIQITNINAAKQQPVQVTKQNLSIFEKDASTLNSGSQSQGYVPTEHPDIFAEHSDIFLQQQPQPQLPSQDGRFQTKPEVVNLLDLE